MHFLLDSIFLNPSKSLNGFEVAKRILERTSPACRGQEQ